MTDSMPSFFGLLQERKSPSPFFTGPKAKDYVENMPDFGDIYSPPGKEKSFLDKFIDRGFTQNEALKKMFTDEDPYKTYRPVEKSSQERFFDFVSGLGKGGDSGFSQVGPNLSIRRGNNNAVNEAIALKNQQEIQKAAEARQAKSSVGRMAGSVLGNALFPGVGGIVGGVLGGFLCDIRLKEDITLLQKSEVNDVLSECAFFVKDLNECS